MNRNELYLLQKIIQSGQESGKFYIYWKNPDYKCSKSGDRFYITHTNGTTEGLREAHESKDFYVFNIETQTDMGKE